MKRGWLSSTCPLARSTLYALQIYRRQVFKGGLSRTGMEEGEQFRYFAQEVRTGVGCDEGWCGVRGPVLPGALLHGACRLCSKVHRPCCSLEVRIFTLARAQELRDLFRLEPSECESSKTQRELHAMHAHQASAGLVGTAQLRRHWCCFPCDINAQSCT